uniref:Uncharacterized protein n=1 Tax=Ananas comosus var. bracteatus TaxID=296719 RepID=A0A6V7Q8W6_ANACO|nr:unnamed protein product [Ananas comosus var. bracteatus]
MKGRSVKLREAHRGSGAASLCSVVWGPDGSRVATASAADASVSVHDLVAHPPRPPAAIRHHRDGVTALALALGPICGSLASGSIDHSVKLYSFPEGEFQSNITRFTLPIRSLIFNRSGSLLAAAGDDDGIKLIATIDNTISKVLKGHRGSVTSLSFDPKNEFLASMDSFGTVVYWELSSGKPLHTLKAVAPNTDSDNSISNVLSWRPDGEMLAVPGLRNDVVMYDRDTGEKLFTLKGDHERSVCALCWSPNGKYLATSGLDKQPNGNALAVIDVMGKFGIWESVVPPSMKSPIDGAPSLQGRHTNGSLLFDDEDEKPSTSGSLDDVIDEREDDLLHQIESRKRNSTKCKESAGKGKEECVISGKLRSTRMQEVFQPGSTPSQHGKRRFLSYNMLGCITTLENEGYSHVEVDFHDTGSGPRVPSMTDYFGFTMASLNENGSVFANPCKGEKNMSTLMYRPFSSWANNSEWSMRFEGEEVKAVALGTGWVAAVTSLNFLRIFTEGGLQRHILSVTGPVVTAAGFRDLLAVVTHASDCPPSGDQMLEVKVFNISKGTQSVNCRLPLTPCSSLTWFGFSEEGRLSSYDSKGVLRVFCDQFGGSWLPLFSSIKARKSEDESHWVVGLNSSKLFCIVCKSPDTYPSVMPKPVLTILDLSSPLASSDLGAADLENEFIISNLHLSQMQKKIEEMVASGQDTTGLDDEAFSTEAAIDRCILRLIASCCNACRATELVKLLSLEKSVKGAIKLVTALKLPMLAERFSNILEERMFSESKGPRGIPSVDSNATVAKNVPPIKASLTSETIKIEPSGSKPPLTLPAAHFSKQERSKESKDGSATMPLKAIPKVSKDHERKIEEKAKKEGDTDILKITNRGATKEGNDRVELKDRSETCSSNGSDHRESNRPANPFAKSSTNQGKLSLLDSIKKMKKADHEKDEKANNKKPRV